MLKTNVIGVLRTARTFQSLLKNTGGRILTLGATECGDAGLVAYTAARYGVEGASHALRKEFEPLGIKVVTLNPGVTQAETMFMPPKFAK